MSGEEVGIVNWLHSAVDNHPVCAYNPSSFRDGPRCARRRYADLNRIYSERPESLQLGGGSYDAGYLIWGEVVKG